MKRTGLLNLLALCALASATTASAQLVITSGNQTKTIDFQSDVGWDGPSDTVGDNVFKWNNGSGNQRNLLEQQAPIWTGTDGYGLSADAFSWLATGVSTGAGTGIATAFGDLNSDGDFLDETNVIAGVNFIDRATVGVGDATDFLYAIGRNGGNNQPWRGYELTLRVQNTSGITIGNWSVSLNTWFGDTDNSNADVSLSYSTDNVNFTMIDGYTTSNNGGVYEAAPLSGSDIPASVANGDYLYLKFANSRSGGSGAGILIDDWTVSSTIPEPSTYAALAGLVALAGVIARRRRRQA